jgi:uncharacterized protein YdeI (YjbR/CyaY-like superfamily)
MNPKVDEFLNEASNWQDEMKILRTIALDCGLTEEYKWKQPCYTFQKSNVAIISGFKEYCVLSFFKGSLLRDTNGILTSPGEHSQATRMIQFTNFKRVIELEPIIKAYLFEAIEIEKAGLKVKFKKTSEFAVPTELQYKLNNDVAFKRAYEALTPGRQRGYILYFSAPKQSQTRISRIEKSTQRIFDGMGLNDCVCGLSKRKPRCDGSHKHSK